MVRRKEDIQRALTAFDGRRVAPLKDAVGLPLTPEAETAILDALAGPDQVGATWMVKALAEAGRLSEAQLAEAFANFPKLTEPDAILHLLQSVQYAPGAAKPYLPDFVRLAGSDKLFLRVWTFDAYCRVAALNGPMADVTARIEQGLTDRSKAMQARARALAREFGVKVQQKS
ncbi:MAG: hypothetical protein JJ938_15505 [Roseicyclus sp.]|nr:hypothetical protein [Roseicyclus sp.]MBO6626285.1 hypothetical protein [Roseicyclus sp.]MBO6920575.1 hypothetical protein [Roseicyclus sp.]